MLILNALVEHIWEQQKQMKKALQKEDGRQLAVRVKRLLYANL